MNRIRHLLRLVGVLAGLAIALVAAIAGPTAAFAARYPPPDNWGPGHLPPGWNKHPSLPVQVHTVVIGGMPGWQIVLIAAGTALLAAAVAVLAYRAWTARRTPVGAAV